MIIQTNWNDYSKLFCIFWWYYVHKWGKKYINLKKSNYSLVLMHLCYFCVEFLSQRHKLAQIILQTNNDVILNIVVYFGNIMYINEGRNDLELKHTDWSDV
jgi:hypothetical protein